MQILTYAFYTLKSLNAEWLDQALQWHEMYCHDLEIMSLNPDQVELWVHTTSVQVVLEPKLQISMEHHDPMKTENSRLVNKIL